MGYREEKSEEAKAFGKKAEQMAADALLLDGFTIRERNYRPKGTHLEVDIIAQKDDLMVFVEVKARTTPGVDPADAVDDKKIRNLCRAANNYLLNLPHDYRYRFDIFSVEQRGSEIIVEHIPDAFLPPLTNR